MVHTTSSLFRAVRQVLSTLSRRLRKRSSTSPCLSDVPDLKLLSVYPCLYKMFRVNTTPTHTITDKTFDFGIAEILVGWRKTHLGLEIEVPRETHCHSQVLPPVALLRPNRFSVFSKGIQMSLWNIQFKINKYSLPKLLIYVYLHNAELVMYFTHRVTLVESIFILINFFTIQNWKASIPDSYFFCICRYVT